MIISSVKNIAAFEEGHFNGIPLAKTDRAQTMLVCLEPGQAIPVHHPEVELTMVIVEGQATLVCGDEDLQQAGPGAVMHSKAGEARVLKADTRTLAVVVVTPPATEQDHQEVFEHLKKGTWR